MPVNMVQIVFPDRPRFLRFDINAIADLEDMTGKSVAEALSNRQKIGFSMIRALLWAGLKHEEPMLTVEAAGELINLFVEKGGTIGILMAKVGEAIMSSGVFAPSGKKGGKPSDPPAEEKPAPLS